MQRTDRVIADLATLPAELNRILPRFAAAELHFNLPPDEWSPAERFSALEHVCHLRDFEREIYPERLRRLCEETDPLLPQVDGYQLAVERRYANQSLSQALEEFAAARRRTLATLERLPAAAWERRGRFEEFGPLTVSGLVAVIRSHDLQHLSGLLWLLAKLESRPA